MCDPIALPAMVATVARLPGMAGGTWPPDVSLCCGGHKNLLKHDDTRPQTLVQSQHPGGPTITGYEACGLEGCWEKGMQDLSKVVLI